MILNSKLYTVCCKSKYSEYLCSISKIRLLYLQLYTFTLAFFSIFFKQVRSVKLAHEKRNFWSEFIFLINYPVDKGRKLNVHKTFRRRPGRLPNVLCTFNLRPVSTGYIFLEISACFPNPGINDWPWKILRMYFVFTVFSWFIKQLLCNFLTLRILKIT